MMWSKLMLESFIIYLCYTSRCSDRFKNKNFNATATNETLRKTEPAALSRSPEALNFTDTLKPTSGSDDTNSNVTIRGDIQNDEFSTSDETWEEIDGQVSSAPTDDLVTDNEYEVTALNSNILEIVSTTLPTILRGPDTPRSILPTPTAPTPTLSPPDVLYKVSDSGRIRCDGNMEDFPSEWSGVKTDDLLLLSIPPSDMFSWNNSVDDPSLWKII